MKLKSPDGKMEANSETPKSRLAAETKAEFTQGK
jgi:hypothetical protein